MNNSKQLYCHYDQGADVFYLSQGKSSSKDISMEAPDDMVLRFDPKTHKMRGLTILNFSARAKKEQPIPLPVDINLIQPKNLSFESLIAKS